MVAIFPDGSWLDENTRLRGPNNEHLCPVCMFYSLALCGNIDVDHHVQAFHRAGGIYYNHQPGGFIPLKLRDPKHRKEEVKARKEPQQSLWKAI